ncbi:MULTISPECIES: glycosyltransferase [unclassified Caballeronia]|uniref:glycosyltransferase family 2 protein n=1 Tax=unclassified Caballeronia TaxID=2646786 RepID=UPI002027BCAF|nr:MULTISPECIES: glycosyltransferase [unclassified Caballeronia]
MSMPQVSMIVPVYNHEAFAVETVNSVLAQTYPNLQIIIVDDGSTDDSYSIIAKSFGDAITLVRRVNGGPSAALNEGLKLAQGDYIALLGGDDVCEPDRVAHQIELFRATSNDIVFSSPTMIDSNGAILPDSSFPVLYREIPAGLNVFRELFITGNFFCAPSAMLKSSVVRQIGMFHEGLIALQDFEYWLRASGKGLKLSTFDHRVVRYRRHSNNLTSTLSTKTTVSEAAYILKRALDLARPEIVRASFPHILPYCAEQHTPLTLFEKVLLLMSHPLHDVRQIGSQLAIDLLDNEEEKEKLAGRDVNLFQMIFNATRTH